jgi:hypothetical protein
VYEAKYIYQLPDQAIEQLLPFVGEVSLRHLTHRGTQQLELQKVHLTASKPLAGIEASLYGKTPCQNWSVEESKHEKNILQHENGSHRSSKSATIASSSTTYQSLGDIRKSVPIKFSTSVPLTHALTVNAFPSQKSLQHNPSLQRMSSESSVLSQNKKIADKYIGMGGKVIPSSNVPVSANPKSQSAPPPTVPYSALGETASNFINLPTVSARIASDLSPSRNFTPQLSSGKDASISLSPAVPSSSSDSSDIPPYSLSSSSCSSTPMGPVLPENCRVESTVASNPMKKVVDLSETARDAALIQGRPNPFTTKTASLSSSPTLFSPVSQSSSTSTSTGSSSCVSNYFLSVVPEDEPAAASEMPPSQPSDEQFERCSFFKPQASRQDALRLLANTQYTYLLRYCSEPSELINGRPNPNLFVLTYFNAKANDWFHVKLFRNVDLGLSEFKSHGPYHASFAAFLAAAQGTREHAHRLRPLDS